MSDKSDFWGCSHSSWGMLLLFASINLFLSLILFPATVEIYDISTKIRTARAKVESAASSVDANTVFDPTALAVSATTTPVATTTIAAYLKATNQLANVQAMNTYNEALLFWSNTYTAVFLGSIFAPQTIDYYFIPQSVNNGATQTAQLDMMATITLSTGTSSTNPQTAQTLGTLTIAPAPVNASIGSYNAMEKAVTAGIETPLARLETIGAFYFFQTIMAVVAFIYFVRCYRREEGPRHGIVICAIGFMAMYIGWLAGFNRRSIIDVGGLFGFWLTDSVASSVINWLGFLGSPFLGLILLFWILMTVYCSYVETSCGCADKGTEADTRAEADNRAEAKTTLA